MYERHIPDNRGKKFSGINVKPVESKDDKKLGDAQRKYDSSNQYAWEDRQAMLFSVFFMFLSSKSLLLRQSQYRTTSCPSPRLVKVEKENTCACA